MVTINFSKKKIYAYQYNGTMKKRCVFKNLSDKYGEPEAVSADGLSFLFVKYIKHDIFLTVLRLNLSDDIQEGFEVATRYKALNLKKLKIQFINSLDPRLEVRVEDLKLKYDINYDTNCDENCEKDCQNPCGENLFDIAVSMQYKEISSVFLLVDYNKGTLDVEWNQIDEHLFDLQDVNSYVRNFSISKKFIYYWTKFEIFYKEIANLQNEPIRIKLPIMPPSETCELQGWVHSVYTGDADDKIAIMIKTKVNDQNCYLITWDTVKRKEIDAFEIPEDTRVFFDTKGEIYSTHQNQVLMCGLKVRLTCFDTEYLQNSRSIFKNEKMGLSRGHHIDDEFNRWIFLNEYILLPYSFMTFLIRQKHQELGTHNHNDYVFDVEQYNFIYNKQTIFTFDIEKCLDYNYMRYLVESMHKYDPILLDLLQYYNEDPNAKDDYEFDDQILTWQSETQAEIDEERCKCCQSSCWLNSCCCRQIKKKAIEKDDPRNRSALGLLMNVADGTGSYLMKMFYESEQVNTKKTPLHVAVFGVPRKNEILRSKDESRLKKLILEHMCMITYKNETAFTDIFPCLLLQPGFLKYFESLQFQTQALKLKTQLKVKDPFDDDFIVKMEQQNCSYFDQNFFTNHFNEIKIKEKFYTADKYNMLQLDPKKMKIGREIVPNFDVDIQAMRVDWIVDQSSGEHFLECMIQCANPDLYKNKSVKILINFLFSKFRNKILLTRLPLYAGQVGTFVLALLLDDRMDDSGNIYQLSPKLQLFGFWLLLLVVLAITGIMFYQIWKSYRVFFKQAWNYYEIIYVLLTIYIAINKQNYWYRCTDKQSEKNWIRIEEARKVYNEHNDDHTIKNIFDWVIFFWGDKGHCQDIQRMNRKAEAYLALIVWFKIVFFLQLSNRFAPMVQVIYQICWKIRYLAIVYTAIVGGFSQAFHILGQNQMAFDGIPVGSHPIYTTFKGAIIYIFKLVFFLEPGLEFFEGSARIPPENTMAFWLWLCWIVGVFTLIIHLLNMLIGMMGDIQSKETENREMHLLKYKLNVVVDNWWINAIDPEGLKYIISATIKEDDDDVKIEHLDYRKKVVQNLRESCIYELSKIKDIQDVKNSNSI